MEGHGEQEDMGQRQPPDDSPSCDCWLPFALNRSIVLYGYHDTYGVHSLIYPSSPPRPKPTASLSKQRQIQRHTTPSPRSVPLRPSSKGARLWQRVIRLEFPPRILHRWSIAYTASSAETKTTTASASCPLGSVGEGIGGRARKSVR